MSVQHPEELLRRWRNEADALHGRGLRTPARLIRSMADELEAVLERQANEVLTLQEASTESGYSADHLGRLVRSGEIRNAGRPGAPRIRRKDLPRKGGLTTPAPAATLEKSKVAIVRSIASRGR